MAMHEPGSWIVFLERDSQVAIGWERCYVTSRRVDKVEGSGSEREYSCCLADNVEVMAVEMNRVINANTAQALDNISSPFVGCGSLSTG
jgi:hypothetical protein